MLVRISREARATKHFCCRRYLSRREPYCRTGTLVRGPVRRCSTLVAKGYLATSIDPLILQEHIRIVSTSLGAHATPVAFLTALGEEHHDRIEWSRTIGRCQLRT